MLRAGLRIRIFSLCSSRISWLVSISCSCCIGRVLEEVIVRVFGFHVCAEFKFCGLKLCVLLACLLLSFSRKWQSGYIFCDGFLNLVL